MPELPEVEVVRRGLAAHVAGRTVAHLEVLHPRATRRHRAGPADLSSRVVGRTLARVSRRGKYLWIPLEEGRLTPDDTSAQVGDALVAHLGMSGQLLVGSAPGETDKHLRVRVQFTDGGPDLRFVDQRTFGGLAVEALVGDGAEGRVPSSVAHIARDPLDPLFDDDAFGAALRRKDTGLKRALLDQSLVSGIGNIYADEALWRSRLHFARSTRTLRRSEAARVLDQAREVMKEALAQGGTSFDSLYVNVNGESGYFERALAVYGRVGRPCDRCGTPIRRDPFMNRSSYTCPRCQSRPRNGHG